MIWIARSLRVNCWKRVALRASWRTVSWEPVQQSPMLECSSPSMQVAVIWRA